MSEQDTEIALAGLNDLFANLLRAQAPVDGWQWLQEQAGISQRLPQTFAAIPRRVGRNLLSLPSENEARMAGLRPGWRLEGWSVDRAARVWLLMQVPYADEERYVRTIQTLFTGAEVTEQVALYSALPVLRFSSRWSDRCAEGIRSNIADVLEAIMCNNPFPAEHLSRNAWNQMVLKAFFTEKPVARIVGLMERANEPLAFTLSDYAHERWAAGRVVSPLLWWCVGPFLNERLFGDIERLLTSSFLPDREAALLACAGSSYSPAKKALEQHAATASRIASGELTWLSLAQKTNDYVLQQ